MKSSQIATVAARFSSAAYLEKLMGELDRAAICQRIGQARDEAGLTQPELAELLEPKVHMRTIQTWESVKQPRVPWDRLDEIARVTGRTKEWLLHGKEALPHSEEELRAMIREELGDVMGLLRSIEERLDGP